MSFTQTKIYNLALSSLLLAKEVTEISTDTSNEVRILNTHYDIALESTLADLDLDALVKTIPLELLANLTTGPWLYVYKYPNDCAKFRRLESQQITDNKLTHIAKRTGLYNDQKSIFTNEVEAIAECLPKSVPLAALGPMAGLALAYRLAFLSAPLIVGKGAKKLREQINDAYVIAKAEAQENDTNENFIYEDDSLRSEFVQARLE